MVKLTNKFKIYISLLLLFNFICSCNGIKYTLTKRFWGYSYKEVNLYKNGEFYVHDYNHMLGETEYYGIWTENNDTIILNIQRTKRPDISPTEIYVKESNFGNKDSIYFKINVLDCSTNAGVLIIDDAEFYIEDNGLLRIEKSQIEKIIFNPRFCYADMIYKVKDSTANFFDIDIINQLEPYSTTDVKYIKKSTKLIPIIDDCVRPEYLLRRRLISW